MMVAALLAALQASAGPVPAEDGGMILAAAEAPRDARRAEVDAELRWDGPVSVTWETSDEGEIVARYDRPLPPEAIDTFRAAAGERIGRFEWNDASFLLQAAPGYLVRAEQSDGAVRLIFSAAEPLAGEGSGAPSHDYELAAAAADQAAGYPGRARRQLRALQESYPDDRGVARALADAEAAIGARIRAARAYRALGATDPEASQIVREAGGTAGVATLIRDGTGLRQTEVGARVALPLAGEVSAEGALRVLRTEADIAVDRFGRSVPIDRRTGIAEVAARGFIGGVAQIEALGATWLTGSPGASVRFRFGAPETELRLYAAYRLPDISTAEQAAFGGFIHRLSAGGTVRLSPSLVAQLDGTVSRYGLADQGVLARTTGVSGGLDFLARRPEPWLALTYRLEAEYAGRVDRRAGGLLALPYVDRENHTFQAAIGKRFGAVQVGAAGGWTFDRYGGDGPTATANAGASVGGWRGELAAGVSSVSRPNFPGRQTFLRASLVRSLGRP